MEAALLEAKEEVFALNGFEFELKRGSERPTECLLKCVPHSKNSTFGVAGNAKITNRVSRIVELLGF